jgi:NAD(P)-dependent dehydrogenase (short-subunit alcohol dehydrogenase family)
MAELEGHQGANVGESPLEEQRVEGGASEPQGQPWPGRASDMRPLPDHGEETYRGANKLLGKKALITGGDSGIGRAVAIAFAREGADVAIVYAHEREDEDAEQTLRWVREAGRHGVAVREDLSSAAACQRVVEWARAELLGLNILVNNAALHFERDSFLEVEPEQLEKVFRTNLFAPLWLSQAVVLGFVAGDCIVNTGSVVALRGHPGLSDYAASKAGLHNLTLTLATALAERGVRVNCVAPGPVWTPLVAAGRQEEKHETFGQNTFWGRPAQPAEIAPSFVFLACADSRYYTGEVLAPTGSIDTSLK